VLRFILGYTVTVLDVKINC